MRPWRTAHRQKQKSKNRLKISCGKKAQISNVLRILSGIIKKRGVSYETKSAAGYPIVKQNQSVKDLVAVNKQMLLILEKLKLTTDNVDAGVDETL